MNSSKYLTASTKKASSHKRTATNHKGIKSEPAKKYIETKLKKHDEEKFLVLYLNSQHKVINDEILFSGSIAKSEVHPRVIAKRCLEENAAGIIIAHNHPSGLSKPSESDKRITEIIQEALDLFEIKVLDHIIVGDTNFSMCEHGYI